jgi:hypothetical protein
MAARRAVTFINSDPTLLALFLRYLETEGVGRDSVGFRLSIHDSVDVEAAMTTGGSRYWISLGSGLVIEVPRSRDLYWRIEATMMALAETLDLAREGSSPGG